MVAISTRSTIIDPSNQKGNKMSEYMETKMYGMTEAEIRSHYMRSATAERCGLEMVVMSILSDCQEMLTMGAGPRAVEYTRQKLNVAKFILCEIQDQKTLA
jgi:hypothetical protein